MLTIGPTLTNRYFIAVISEVDVMNTTIIGIITFELYSRNDKDIIERIISKRAM